MTEITTRSVDRDVIAQASQEKRVLLTEDKDFGQLVFASHADSAGVILIRYPGNARKSLQEAFIVMQPGYIRVSLAK